ncbi:TMEM165/GDT1 family protein [Candidatus Bathyarchaeota archaeon]|jgi:putative Ca2+/H+ antiporter (TMEM165/GDT1 family)|nr:TMEM165/GDT1 family protein [Candidatus Bathyarchaeota archaeon]
MDLLPLVSSFGIIALAELGDKTQLTVISLSSCKKARTVFIGAILAFALIDGVSALIGGTVATFIPKMWIGLGAGVAFLLFGVYSLLSKSEEAKVEKRSVTAAHCFSLVALMELGDKTQLSVIALAAEYDAPLMVFVGVILALALLTGIGVALGTVISRFVPMRYVKIGSSLIFIVFGILFLFGAISGTKLL